jgi:dTDP-4-amino-4,6-dideoxygalactose transaminase
MLRHQLPVYSPVSWRGIVQGSRALLPGGRAAELDECLRQGLRRRYGARDVLLTDSGTSALRLAIIGALGDSSRPVALPSYGCYDLATAAEGAGATVCLYDVDPITLAPDLESVAAAMAAEPAAVVVAYVFGHPIDLESLAAVIPDVLLIEDAAQGAGGEFRGRPLGSWGSVSVLSFGRGKGMTGGGGGALLANDDAGEVALERARAVLRDRKPERGTRAMAALAAQLILGRPALYGIPSSLPFLHLGETRYHVPGEAKPASPATLAALETAFPLADRAVAGRRRKAGRLLEWLDEAPHLVAPSAVPGAESGYLRLPALVRGAPRDALVLESRRLGVAAGYPMTLAELPSLEPHICHVSNRRGASDLAANLITLPTHAFLSEGDLRSLEAWITRARAPVRETPRSEAAP